MNHLRAMLNEGKTAVGTHVSLNNPVITELVGSCGFDYVWIDTEHTLAFLLPSRYNEEKDERKCLKCFQTIC